MVGMIQFSNAEEKLGHLKSLGNIPSINPKEYNPEGEYFRLDYLSHAEFGVGFVEEVLDEKSIKVFFSSGEKVLEQRSYLGKVV